MAKKEYFDFLDDVIINDVKIKNLFQKFIITYSTVSSNDDILLDYVLSDFDSPQNLAFQWYNDKKYYWILLLINNVVDYFYDWLLSYEELKTLTNQYWTDGITYDFTNKEDLFAYLVSENENKRNIKYLNPIYLNEFLKQVGQE